MFAGLSAFPLTPSMNDRLDEFARLVARLATADVDGITVSGSTGSYACLDRWGRRRVVEIAVRHVGATPVSVGIGAPRTGHVVASAADAHDVGAAGVLLAPASCQRLTEADVDSLCRDVTASLSVPLDVYDDPAPLTSPSPTRCTLGSPGCHRRSRPRSQVCRRSWHRRPSASHDRALLPDGVTIGVCGDALGLSAGWETWYPAVAGAVPDAVAPIVRAALDGDAPRADACCARLQPLWDRVDAHGSVRVIAALAELLGLVDAPSLPRPVLGPDAAGRARAALLVDRLDPR